MKNVLARLTISVALSALAPEAYGMSPASQEELVCGASSMFLGKVLKASSAGGNVVDLTIKLIDELPGATQHVMKSTSIEASASVRHPLLLDNGHLEQSEEDGDLEAGIEASNDSIFRTLLSDSDVQKAFLGRRFYFGVWLGPLGPRTWVKTWKVDGLGPIVWKQACPHSVWRPKQNVR